MWTLRARLILFERSHYSSILMYTCKLASAMAGFGCSKKKVMSSVEESMYFHGCVRICISCMNRIERVSENTKSCGYPLEKHLLVDGVQLRTV